MFKGKLEEYPFLQAIRKGMILTIPPVLVGCLAILLNSLPIDAYQTFLAENEIGRVLASFYQLINNATIEVYSLYVIVAVSYSYERALQRKHRGSLPLLCLCSYMVFTTTLGDRFGVDASVFSNKHLLEALTVVFFSSKLYFWVEKFKIFKETYLADGVGSTFSFTLNEILPSAIVIWIFAFLNLASVSVLGTNQLQSILSGVIYNLFLGIGRSCLSGVLFLVMVHFFWIFGIHGNNMLNSVSTEIFEGGVKVNQALLQAEVMPTEILSKTFIDVFVLMGGSGVALCLCFALLIAGKRIGFKDLAKLSLPFALFNINELMIFGLPIVLNGTFAIPFIIVPVVTYLVSYAAVYLGIVPITINTVEWTTPIIWSGYLATGSYAGSLLQVFNLILGTIIYIPFVKLSYSIYRMNFNRDIERMVEIVKACEQTGERPVLINRRDMISSTAKSLVAELKDAVAKGKIELYYQPQMKNTEELAGFEALFRWKSSLSEGFIYPPLIIALADEAQFISKLGYYIIEKACSDTEKLAELYPKAKLKVSVNIVAQQLNDSNFNRIVEETLKRHDLKRNILGIEITEQTALSSSQVINDRLAELKKHNISIIMDDFGMGHSSLMYLENNLFNIVKLDGSLVRDVLTNENKVNIITSIMYLSNSMGFDVIAEYVETKEQRDLLEKLGCKIYQGHFYGGALSFEEALEFCKKCNL